MKFRPSFRSLVEKTKAPFRAIGDVYLLVDDIVWHGYDWMISKGQPYPRMGPREWLAVACAGAAIFLNGISLIPLPKKDLLEIIGYLWVAGISMEVLRYPSQSRDGTMTTSPALSFIQHFRLATLGMVAYTAIAGDSPAETQNSLTGFLAASSAYLADSSSTGLLDRIQRSTDRSLAVQEIQ